jgi:LuxR family maltose regulon positive regulatory protein
MKKANLILQTKLEPPRVKGTILRRDRLLALLRENLDKKLILLCADAGYGKTTLLAQFCEELTVPFVYYDLDDTDSNMAAFFSYLVAGVRRYDPGFGKAVEDLIPQTGNVDIVVGTFINQFISRSKEGFYIILDDFHYLQNNRKICSAIDYLLRHLPKNLHLVISSRAVPNINLTYYLAKQELFKIEKENLRFNYEEIQSLLNVVYGLKISSDDIKRIAEFSEGWITVLQLILQRIKTAGEETTQDTLNSYAASDENIFNYFAREVFEQTAKQIKEFLLKTSVLDYLNPIVCDSLLNIRRSKKIIAYLDSENMFISKVGNNYQYHPIFHEFLRNKLKQYFTSSIVKKLHYKAGNHLLAQNDYTSAVKHFIAAERYANAARILEANHLYWMNRADYSSFIQLVESFPDAILSKYPCLLLRKADALDNLDKKTQALRLTEAVLKLFRRKRDKKGTAQALILKALIFYSQGQRRKGIYHANKAYGLVKYKDSPLKADILMQLGSMYRDACRYEKAQECFEAALKILHRHEDCELEESLLTRIALLQFTMCNFKEADRLFMEILARFSDSLSGHSLLYKYSTVVVINIDSGDYQKAWDYLARAEEMLLKYNDPWITKYLVYMRGKLHWSEGRFHKAIEFLTEAIDKYETFSRILDPYILDDIVDSYLRLGEPNKARDVFAKMDSVRDIINETPNLLVDYLTIKGSLLTVEGKFADAVTSLKDALKKARNIGNPYISMTTYYKLSRCYYKQGSHEQALTYFKKCLNTAHLKDYDAYLLVEARDDIDLLRLAIENGYMVDYVLGILQRVDTEQAKNLLNWMQIERGIFDLDCRLLGKLEIRDTQGRVIKPNWRTKNTEELFVLFISGQKKKYSKDELIDMFWPHKNLRGAAHSLHVEISALRNTLKEILRSDFDKQKIVVYANQYYYLNPKVYISTDVQKYQQLVNQAGAAMTQNRTKAKSFLKQAFDLYRGDFCEGIQAEWCDEMKSHYKKSVLDVLKKLGRVCYDEEAYQEGLELLDRALGIDDTDEAVHVEIMRCLQALNNSDGVQRQYKKLVKSLNRVGILTPSREATELYQASLR